MGGPWENYQSVAPQDGPWTKYAAPSPSLMDSAVDTIKSLPYDAIEGVNNLPKLPAGMVSMASGLGAQIGNKLHNLTSDQPWNDAQQTQNIQDAKNFKGDGFIDKYGQTLQQIPTISQLAQTVGGTLSNIGNDNNLTPSDILDEATNKDHNPLISALHAPTTPIGQAVGNVVQAIPQGAAFGLGPTASAGISAGSQIADKVSPDNPALQAATMFAGSKTPDVASNIGEGIGIRAKGAFADSQDKIDATSDKNWQDAHNSFNSSSSAKAALTPQASQTAVAKIVQDVGNLNSRHSDTAAELSDLQNKAKAGTLTLSDLDEFRQNFGDVIKDNTKSKIDGGGLNSDGQKALLAKNSIVDTIGNLKPNDFAAGGPQAASDLLTGINQYAKAARFDRIANIVKDSEGDSTAIQAKLKSFLKNPKNTLGFSPEEISSLEDAANRTIAQKIERGAGTFGFDLGKVKNVALPTLLAENAAAGAASAIPHGLPLAVAGTILRQTGKYAARGKLQNALDLVNSRDTSPATQGTGSAVAPAPFPPAPPGASFQAWKAMNPNTPMNAMGTTGQAAPAPPAQTVTTQPMSYTSVQSEQAPDSDDDMARIAKAESGGNPNAKNPKSSASGLMQFTNKTWAQMVQKYGKDTGIKLSDKSNPQAQQVMARKYADENIKYLNQNIGRMPNLGEVYMAHMFGPHGAATLINANPNQEAIMLYPRKVIDANHNIFFSKGTPRTVEQVKQLLAQKVS